MNCPYGSGRPHLFSRGGICAHCGERFAPSVTPPPKMRLVDMLCAQEGGSLCSICHRQFADGDDICSGGSHQIGISYPVPAPA